MKKANTLLGMLALGCSDPVLQARGADGLVDLAVC